MAVAVAECADVWSNLSFIDTSSSNLKYIHDLGVPGIYMHGVPSTGLGTVTRLRINWPSLVPLFSLAGSQGYENILAI